MGYDATKIDEEYRSAGRLFKLVSRPSKTGFRLLNLGLQSGKGAELDGADSDTVFLNRSDGKGQFRARVFRPKPIHPPLPIIVYFHGGGYAMGIGDQSNLLPLYRNLMQTRPCIIIAPDYRLSMTDPYPAGLHDCYDTLLWAKAHAARLGGNPSQIMVAGDSAGGGLTVAVSMLARDRGDVNIAFQMPIYPMIDDRQVNPSAVNNEMPVWGSKHNRVAWSMYLSNVTERGLETPIYAAPARATDYSNLPPAATYVGSLDPFCDETRFFVDKLRAAGVPVAFEVFEGCYHGFDAAVPKAAKSQAAMQFLLDAYADAVDTHFAEQTDVTAALPLTPTPLKRTKPPKLRTLRTVGPDYALTGPNSTTLVQPINSSAESVFASFEDGAAWKEWLNLDVEWTSGKPLGVGSTRTVIANGQQIDEVFTVWEPPLRMGFYFIFTTLPLATFAEDYTLKPTGENSCELHWSYAYEWGGPLPSIFGRIFGMIFARSGRASLKKLANLMENTDRYDT